MTLVFPLPFIIGSYIDVMCIGIATVCYGSFVTWFVLIKYTTQTACIIKAYLECFTFLYPHINVTPKMHYLIHLPEQMEL